VRVRDLFMAGIAHELRGPLSALRLSAAYLARVPQTPELTKASARISTSASRLKSLVDDLVEFSHWRLQELVLERRPLDLGPWLAGELDPLRLLWPARELHLELHGPMQGDWDERRLRQVLGHLVEFGCAAGEPAEPVTVRVNGSAQDVVLSVSRLARLDDEAGSESAFDPLPAGNRVFDPKAIALALPLTRTIARAHGGDAVLQFESPRVTLVVRLPR
jgi:signal transduction histidine kinase